MIKDINLKLGIASVLLCAFLLNCLGPMPLVLAQGIILPRPGQILNLSSAYTPASLQGLTINPQNSFQFTFLVQKGNRPLLPNEKNEEYLKLIKYFMASITIPDRDQWVNLSPYEHDRMIADNFAQTEMGRDLLAEDYILKQITASLIYPEREIGKKFWNEVYAKAQQKYGTTNIPVNTFNKVWILPDEALMYEHGNSVFILKSHLKVMLEEDYLANSRHSEGVRSTTEESKGVLISFANVQDDIIRQIIIPTLEGEVNSGKNFAPLRQIVNSMILAAWYKKKIKDSILAQMYKDKNKIKGTEYRNSVILGKAKDRNISYDSSSSTQNDIEAIYHRYLEAFKRGAYNYIKEEPDPTTHQLLPRKYFSGGFKKQITLTYANSAQISNPPKWAEHPQALEWAKVDMAMSSHVKGVDLKRVTQKNREKWMQLLFEARKSLNKAAHKTKSQLPANSPWKKYWMSAAQVPVNEVVRDPSEPMKGRITRLFQMKYYINQHAMREVILQMMLQAIINKDISQEEYVDFLNLAHRRLMLGKDGKTIYMGWINSTTLREKETTIADRVRSGNLNVSKLYIDMTIPKTLAILKEFINLPQDAGREKIFGVIADYYNSSMNPFPFGSGGANNSFVMNIVNTMLRLKGFKGISHERLDRLTTTKFGKEGMIEVIEKANPVGIKLKLRYKSKDNWMESLIAAKKHLKQAAKTTRAKLPKDSPWRRDWLFAAEVPVNEVVRDPNDNKDGRITRVFQMKYYLNQHAMREVILQMILQTVLNKGMDEKDYINFLNEAHRRLLIGLDGTIIYKGWNRSRYPSRYFRKIKFINKVMSGERDLSETYKSKDINIVLGKFLNFINLKINDREIIFKTIAEYYYTAMHPYPFGPSGANNSFVMNIVNTMLRLKGFNGISHEKFDYGYNKHAMIQQMVQAFERANPVSNAAMIAEIQGVKLKKDKEISLTQIWNAKYLALYSAHRIKKNLPEYSPWRKYWIFAADIPVREIVRFPGSRRGIIEKEYQVDYYRNQYAAREIILEMISRAILHPEMRLDEYEDFLNEAHRALMIGMDGETIYRGANNSLGNFESAYPKEDVIRAVLLGKHDMREKYIGRRLLKSFESLKKFIDLRQDASKTEIIEAVTEYYYTTIIAYPFGPAGANNSFVMNIVNAMLRLKGLNGTNHSNFDYNFFSYEQFIKTVIENNQNPIKMNDDDQNGQIIIMKNEWLLTRITKAKERLKMVTRELKEKLPSNSPWLEHWLNVANVPPEDFVRDPKTPEGKLKKAYQLKYYLNQIAVREIILKMILKAITLQASGKKMRVDEYEYFLNLAHRVLMTGIDGQTVYRGWVISNRPQVLPEVSMIANVLSGQNELTLGFKYDGFLLESYTWFMKFIALTKSPREEVLVKIGTYYFETCGGLPFGGAGANNSLIMNIVNTMLLLQGFKGISHGNLDNYSHSHEALPRFLAAVNAKNSPQDAAMAIQIEGVDIKKKINSQRLMAQIQFAKDVTRLNALRLKYLLPEDSPWMSHWLNASEVPVDEMVRNPKKKSGIIRKQFQVRYYLNQHAARDIILEMIAKAILHPQMRLDEYEDFLNEAHRVLLTGKDGQTIYYGWNMSRNRTYKKEMQKEKFLAHIFMGEEDIRYYYKTIGTLEKSFNAFMKFIHLSPQASEDEIIQTVLNFYFVTLPSLPFGASGANNSFIMNIVNAMLRLKGLKGISHGELDLSLAHGQKDFIKAVKKKNSVENKDINKPQEPTSILYLGKIKQGSLRERILDAKVRLVNVVAGLKRKIPEHSLWSKYWITTALINSKDLVRDPDKPDGKLRKAFQLKYLLNQITVREIVMKMIAKAIILKDDRKQMWIDEYENYINQAHRALLVGLDAHTVYRGWMKSIKIKPMPEAQVINNALSGRYDLSDEYKEKYLKESYEWFIKFINSETASREEIIQIISRYYFNTRIGLPFGPGGANNSLIMNIVNAMLNLYGLNGISHGNLDKFAKFEMANDEFIKAVNQANPKTDAAMKADIPGVTIKSSLPLIWNAKIMTMYSAEGILKNLPIKSPLRRFWMNAADIPVREIVRFQDDLTAGMIKEEFQVNYYRNQYAVREIILGMIARFIHHPEMRLDEYEDFLNQAHRVLLLGRDGRTVYRGEVKSKSELNQLFSEERMRQDTLLGKLDITAGYKMRQLQRSFNAFREFMLLPENATLEHIVTIIGKFYYITLNEGGLPFGVSGANNSFVMNIVNAMLRLKGLNGISHEYLDMYGSSKDVFKFVETVKKSNLPENLPINHPMQVIDLTLTDRSIDESVIRDEQHYLDLFAKGLAKTMPHSFVSQANWMNAAIVPEAEMVRSTKSIAGKLVRPFQLRYKLNQITMREMVLQMMAKAVSLQNTGQIMRLDEYEYYFNLAHRLLLIGRDGQTLYYGWGNSVLGYEGEQEQYFISNVLYGRHDVKKAQRVNLALSYNSFINFIKLLQSFTGKDNSKKQIIKAIEDYYAVTLYEMPFGSGGANNSYIMNIVNAMLRISGLNGISHGNLDKIVFNGRLQDTEEFYQAVLAANPQLANPSADAAMNAKTPGGIDLRGHSLNMLIKRDSNAVPQISQADLANLSQAEGLTPIIISIVPVTDMSFLKS